MRQVNRVARVVWVSNLLMLSYFARASGHVAALHLAGALLPVTRHSIFAWLLSTSFERTVKLHRWLGRLACLATVAHLAAMVAQGFDPFSATPTRDGRGAVFGLLALLGMGLLAG